MANSTGDFTQRELAIIGALTARFPERSLDARIVSVKTEEGAERATLRLTLDDMSSTDFARGRIAGGEPVEAMVEEAAAELEAPGESIGP